MASDEQDTLQPPTPTEVENDQNNPDEESQSDSDTDTDSDSDSEYSSSSESDSEDEDPNKPKKKADKYYTRPGEFEDIPDDDNSPEANVKRFARVLQSRRRLRAQELEDRDHVYHEDLFNFPKDTENWLEQDLKELWADAPLPMTKPGWDPAWADDEDWDIIANEVKAGKDPAIAPFYLPYRKCYPAIPDNHYDISNPKAVIEELDRIEEFLRWVSYVFPDGSSYEGTVWDDLAHGKGVYVAEQGLVRYEGEWLQNNMEGHGVIEVEIPDIEPIPGSKLEAQMRAEGKIIKRDFMSPEDKEWMEMDIEDTVQLVNGRYETPWYENNEWIRQYGQKPEVGRYRYAGQWKHSRMHGCGVYEVNERPIYGRFYFGELVEDPDGCDEDACALHAGIAEVAAAKARMFINKPDGMVREERGPYSDPQHPYFYEEEDVWQAPGFINQFYEVPDYWKTYVHEVDQEREMWLNSFYKAPLRLPMPAELEYWWEKDASPEFILLNKEPEPDPNDPSKLVYTEDPIILHTPTGRVINYIEDEEHGVRMFWQPPVKEGEDVDPEKVEFLPLGFDEFYGREPVVKKETFPSRLVSSVENAFKPWFQKMEKWAEEQRKASEMRKQLIEQEMELVDAELDLEEAIEDMEQELKQQEKEAEKSVDMSSQEEEDVSTSPLPNEKEEVVSPSLEENVEEDEEGEEEEEEEEDDSAPSSFGSVADQGSAKNKGNGSGRSPFSTLSFACSGLLSTVPSMVERSFLSWSIGKSPLSFKVHSPSTKASNCDECSDLVAFPRAYPEKMSMKVKYHADRKYLVKHRSRKVTISAQLSSPPSQSVTPSNHRIDRKQRVKWLRAAPETNSDCILSLHMPVECSNSWCV